MKVGNCRAQTESMVNKTLKVGNCRAQTESMVNKTLKVGNCRAHSLQSTGATARGCPSAMAVDFLKPRWDHKLEENIIL